MRGRGVGLTTLPADIHDGRRPPAKELAVELAEARSDSVGGPCARRDGWCGDILQMARDARGGGWVFVETLGRGGS